VVQPVADVVEPVVQPVADVVQPVVQPVADVVEPVADVVDLAPEATPAAPEPAPVAEPAAAPADDASAPAASVATETPAVAPSTTDSSPGDPPPPPPLLALPGLGIEVAGPPMPTPTLGDRVVSVLDRLAPSGAAFESVLGVFFVSSAPGASMLFLPGSPLGSPFAVGGPAWRMLLYAIAGSEVAGGFVLVMGPTSGRGRLAACRAGSLVVVFGRLLNRVRVLCLSELTRTGLLRHRNIPRALIPRLTAAAQVLRAQLTNPESATGLAGQAGTSVTAIRFGGGRAPAPTPGAPAPLGVPTPVGLPSPSVPAPAPAPSPSPSGAHDGGHSPVSGILAAFATLAALMFAGIVRLRQWLPPAPSARLLASPG
jgi:hypothetical protein